MSSNHKVHVQARIDPELDAWFNENFSVATKQRFIEGCFRYLRLIVEADGLPTPEVYLAKVAKETAAEIITENSNQRIAS